jgi:hypothetical protein
MTAKLTVASPSRETVVATVSYPEGLGWHPPEIGTVHDQAEQRIAAQTRLHGDQLVPLPPH